MRLFFTLLSQLNSREEPVDFYSDLFYFVVLTQLKNTNYLRTSIFLLCVSFLFCCDKSREITYWNALDQNSVFVFETFDPPKVERSIFPFLKVSSASFAIALQSISKNDYEFVYLYKLPQHEYAALLVSKEIKAADQKITSRNYNGFEIKEIRNEENAVNVAFVFIKGFFVLSKSAFLVENAIRTFELREGVNFQTSNKALFQFASIKSDAGNLFINFAQLNKSAITNSSLKESISLFRNFAKSCMLDVKTDESFISMNGFTLDSLKQNPGISDFQNQKAVKFEMAGFVPNYSKALIHYGISDLDKFTKSTPSDSSKVNFGDEIATCFLQDSKDFLIFVELKDQEISSFDSGNYFESYSGYEIRSFKNDFLKRFNQLIPNESLEYFTVKENFIFISKKVEELKRLIDAIESDDTWGKSADFQRFYGRGLQESNISLIIQAPSILENVSEEKWKPLIDSLQLSSISWASVQFSALDNNFYTTANIAMVANENRKNVERKEKDYKSFNLPNSTAKSFLVKNYTTDANELLLQDSTYRLYLYSPEKGVLWQYQTDGMIEGAHQLDYFKNGKLQYFINTTSSMYIIDRLGREVSGFPKKLSFTSQFSNVIDYDKSKNYRFMLTSNNKEVFIFDKSASALEGWAPKRLSAPIKETPAHYRIGGKDYFLVAAGDNSFHLFTRKGDYQKGFPIRLKNYSGDYFLEEGSGLQNSFIYVITNDGIITKQSLDGEIKMEENLVRGMNSKFILSKAVDGKSDFYYFRIDSDKVAVFDKLNQLVFERQNPGSTSLIPSVIMKTKDKAVFGFYDGEQGMSYFFDQAGNSIIKRPLESTIPPLLGKENKTKNIFIYTFFENTIGVTPLN